jgi:hypothetical protein
MPMELSTVLVKQTSSTEAKIALFRSLFRGREDIYPRRFESRKTGKAGYAPACANEWVRGVCEKPRIKCAECPNRRGQGAGPGARRHLESVESPPIRGFGGSDGATQLRTTRWDVNGSRWLSICRF